MQMRAPRVEREGSASWDLPDERGHFGPYGGIFVAETLQAALAELREAYEAARKDPAFLAELGGAVVLLGTALVVGVIGRRLGGVPAAG